MRRDPSRSADARARADESCQDPTPGGVSQRARARARAATDDAGAPLVALAVPALVDNDPAAERAVVRALAALIVADLRRHPPARDGEAA